MRPPHKTAFRRGLATIAVAATATAIAIAGQLPASATDASTARNASAGASTGQPAAAPKLTNLAHLNWLLDSVPLLSGVPGHTTYNQASEPTATAPWVYANRNADGTFTHVGGGSITDAAKGYYSQGSFDADDISRSAVVYLRDWAQNHTASSKQHAYELLRELTYLQTSSGPNAGNVVLWQQHDGTLNPSAIPIEQPNPSDSAESFWLARTVWALGEGYAGFKSADPAFAQFLQQRMDLALGSLDHQSLAKYGTTEIANGVKVPGWMIVNSAGATSEAVLGLSAYVKAAPGDQAAATALARYAEGIDLMTSGGIGKWPFGAILPEENSPTFWHAWAGMEPAALSKAASVLNRSDYQKTAAIDTAQFTAQLLATGGPVNGWTPTPADQTQIAYGVDSRVEGLIAVADATNASGLAQLAGVQAAWYFGANPAGVPVYDPATGVCVDGINSDKTINHNCGAESSIHTELSMLALDAHPDVSRIATSLNRTTATDGLTVVEAESGTLKGSATIVTPPSAWTGSANWSGGKYVQAGAGDTITLTLPPLQGAHRILPIADLGNTSGSGTTQWTASAGARTTNLGSSANTTDAPQGIAPTTVYLQPQTLPGTAPDGTTTLTAHVGGAVNLDAVMVQPVVSHLGLAGTNTTRDVYVNGTDQRVRQHLSAAGPVTVQRFDRFGQSVGGPEMLGSHAAITVEAGGFTVVSSR
ncbi:hypothetical protein G3T36_15635 [Diaminobutyricibacter tongyongensis]|uniref:Uncharacterized protein n=1 Tax=Leifsonia tongyongensis TaxID=1268043 RepID=A0A6L9Y0W1_9MICO|nr:hypothetical protein [Diaminobutyricibacter tongyongensis]NEN07293.1 hypothetical protein [Diaminobutyricibacter tongyongensis]